MARCQVCDGPVVNGRCKLCGMPYRNDEILYHLNESRSEHYKHATPKARSQMRENQIPLADREKSSDKRISNSRKASRFPGGLVGVIVAASVIFSIIGNIKERYEREWAWSTQEIASESEEASSEYFDTDELILLGVLDVSEPEILVSDSHERGTVKPGKYALEISGEYMEILVQYAQSEGVNYSYEFYGPDDQAVLELHEGDRLLVNGYDNKNNFAMMFQIEQYDELSEM